MKKWYQDNGKLLLALIFVAPLGVYGLIKKETKKTWLKIIGLILGIVYTFFGAIFIIGTIYGLSVGTDKLSYDNAVSEMKKGNLEKAKKEFLKINSESEYYGKANLKVKEIDSLFNIEKQKIELELQKEIELKENLKKLRISWSDSIVKSWEGQFITGYNKETQDSILFYLSKNASKSFNSNRESHLPLLRKSYNEYMNRNLSHSFSDSIVIDFIQDPQIRQELIEKSERRDKLQRFFGWKGQHLNLERAIKNSMNDPKSYEHVKTIWEDKGSYLLIETTIRGNNALGAKIIKTYRAKADLNGNVIEIKD